MGFIDKKQSSTKGTIMSNPSEKNIQTISQLYTQMLTAIGENPQREGLIKTPSRAAAALEFLTRGYQENISDVINGALFDSDISEMVVVKNIEFYSLCEHHLLPFFGQCHVAYIPNGRVLGVSKVARIIDVFARRLQIQENLNQQIAQTLMEHTHAQGVGVVIEAQHLCMRMRGVNKQNSVIKTSSMLGNFKDSHKTRSEFLQLIQG
jgi:GTP cyclohydrolase IA